MATCLGRFAAVFFGKLSRIPFLFLGALVASPAAAQITRMVSVDLNGSLPDSWSARPAISADGRYVVFQSGASDLVPGDTNGHFDVFVRDLVAGTTEIVSVDSSGVIGNSDSRYPSISADGRYVAFQSFSTNLIPFDACSDYDVYVRDRVAGTTEKVNLTSAGAQTVLRGGFQPSISADGRYVAFHSAALDLVAWDTNDLDDVFVRDRVAGTTERISVSTAGVEGNGSSAGAVITPDGRFVAFSSTAGTFASGDTSNWDGFVHDRVTHATERVSIASDGSPALGTSWTAAITPDGRFVAFSSTAENLVANDTNSRGDAFLHDRLTGITRRVSLNTGEGEGNGVSDPTGISNDGRYVVMHSLARNLVPGDTNSSLDVFVRDRWTDTTERISLDSDGAQGNGASYEPAISADGRWVAFSSTSTNFIPVDWNGQQDIFVRDREATSFAILCDPVAPSVADCPCSNPPTGPSRGCDNSAGTGGAALRASGTAHLTADTLVFTTSGEKPTALSIVLQGTTFVDTGTIYGQGVRCVGGSLKRLYAKIAVGGSITAPDFGAGDLSVSAQSAAKGDTIQPGQPRWYLVYYRDNGVLGGCPSTSNFNSTQTGQVSWVP